MKRTTVFLPEGLERDLQGLARREGKPLAWFVREALATYVASHRRAAGLPSFAGVGAGQARDVAERHEELLWATPHEAAPPPPAVRARRPASRRAPSAARRTAKR
jgi:predicted transcriptional regulator